MVAEFKDRAPMKTFGQAGTGIFAAPEAIEKEVRDRCQVALIGRIESATERFYAISVERKLKHPAVVTITGTAREKLFGDNFNQR